MDFKYFYHIVEELTPSAERSLTFELSGSAGLSRIRACGISKPVAFKNSLNDIIRLSISKPP